MKKWRFKGGKSLVKGKSRGWWRKKKLEGDGGTKRTYLFSLFYENNCHEGKKKKMKEYMA